MSPVRRRRALRAYLKKLKQSPCTDCGKRKPPSEMTFDHICGEKNFDIGKGIRGHSEAEILYELHLTELCCRICHDQREETRRYSSSLEFC